MSSPCSENTNESRNNNADSPSQNYGNSGGNRPGYHSGSVAVNNTAGTTYYPGRSTTPISPNSQYSTSSNLTATNEHHLPKNENY